MLRNRVLYKHLVFALTTPMKRLRIALLPALLIIVFVQLAFKKENNATLLKQLYESRLADFIQKQEALIATVNKTGFSETNFVLIKERLNAARLAMKNMDFWLRYLEPLAYKKINGPLPVEWETEVFEKFEKPYRREGAGLTLAAIYLDEPTPAKDSLLTLLNESLKMSRLYLEDSLASLLTSPDHLFYCNRLFLLNLATLYNTGFECPDSKNIIPEIRHMLQGIDQIYEIFNRNFPEKKLPAEYTELAKKMTRFVMDQPSDHNQFDHYTFVKDFVNPLFAINQRLIREYGVKSLNYSDYSLNNNCNSIFSKRLYNGQNTKGAFLRIYNQEILKEIENTGRDLFYDPILSGNNLRSCASCHRPDQCFTDTMPRTAPAFDRQHALPRNTPTLVNADLNHLLMLDGRHITLHAQTRDVITNPQEMGSIETDVLKKVLSCSSYKKAFEKFIKHTPEEKEIGIHHITSAVVYYYSRFSLFDSPFDRSMNGTGCISASAQQGFNLFMGKAQCGTCHFIPQFNGVKPPYIGSEFEVLGVPADTSYIRISSDSGRYAVNPAPETLRAFRTGTVRNAARTKPFMHNGVFGSLEQVIEFYNSGGGTGHHLEVGNQTLSSDSLHLSQKEKADLLSFLFSLNEDIPKDRTPEKLPKSSIKALNNRKPGGEY